MVLEQILNQILVRERFDKILEKRGLMQLVYDGKAKLTADQVSMIFRDCIETRMVALHRIYEPDWKKFKVNEQLTILSLYIYAKG